MKFLNWMQSKINGKQSTSVSCRKPAAGVSTKNSGVMHESRKDEFSDWPHGLLAIGTFGNTNLSKGGQESSSSHGRSDCNDNQITEEEEISTSSLSEVLGDNDLDGFTPEEVVKLQEELKKLMWHKPEPALTEEDQRRTLSGRRGGVNLLHLLPLDKFLNCPSSLEVDREVDYISDSSTQRELLLQRSLSVIANMGKNSSPERTKSLKKKSISFLLKKMFVCRSGFPPPAAPPSFRDPFPESRIEKLLRAIISKNLYCQKNSPTAPTAKKFLENGNYYLETDADKDEDDEQEEKEKINDGCRWDKTDDDYIVLEM